jgi:hypothetical protein
MKENKYGSPVRITKKNQEKLRELKYRRGLSSVDEVIYFLLKMQGDKIK